MLDMTVTHPFEVEVVVPPQGIAAQIDAMQEWSLSNAPNHRVRLGLSPVKAWYWRFAALAEATEFQSLFGGTLVMPDPPGTGATSAD